MKTTDRKIITKGKYYFIIECYTNQLIKAKCTIDQNNWVQFNTGHCYGSMYSKGIIYSSEDKAINRLKFLIKNKIKFYNNRLNECNLVLEKLNDSKK